MHEKFKAQLDYLMLIFQKELSLASQHNLLSGNPNKSTIAKIALCIIHYAQKLRASDIHIEPEAQGASLRLRIDGMLQLCYRFPPLIQPYLISYLKIQGGLDITEKRLPQDGAIAPETENLDLRLSIIPVVWGEKAVLRLLARGQQPAHFTGSRTFPSRLPPL